MRSPFPEIDSPGVSILRWSIAAVLVVGLIGCVTKGANSPPDPYFASSRAGIPGFGFGETKVRVTKGASFVEWCLLLAQTDAQRARGLMQVTDPTLGGYDGMLFRYQDDTTENFWMRNTPMPLSIAYISHDGGIVSTADMAPCADRDDCPNYPSAGPYRFSIEVPQGRLPELGIVEGAMVTDLATPCG